MEIRLSVPDEFAAALAPGGADPARAALEAFGIDAYRRRRISAWQLRQLLGIESRFELDDLLKEREVETYTVSDLEQDIATLDILQKPSAA